MAYSNFTLAKVKEDFGLTVDETQDLFADIEAVKPSEILTVTLQDYMSLATAIGTKKARSEFLIAPILTEVRRQLNYQISLFSGTDFNVEIDIPIIYGAVTSGTAWRFLTLSGNRLCIDLVEYYINQVEIILAILLNPI